MIKSTVVSLNVAGLNEVAMQRLRTPFICIRQLSTEYAPRLPTLTETEVEANRP